jgi:hypothetical protein
MLGRLHQWEGRSSSNNVVAVSPRNLKLIRRENSRKVLCCALALHVDLMLHSLGGDGVKFQGNACAHNIVLTFVLDLAHAFAPVIALN